MELKILFQTNLPGWGGAKCLCWQQLVWQSQLSSAIPSQAQHRLHFTVNKSDCIWHIFKMKIFIFSALISSYGKLLFPLIPLLIVIYFIFWKKAGSLHLLNALFSSVNIERKVCMYIVQCLTFQFSMSEYLVLFFNLISFFRWWLILLLCVFLCYTGT